MISKDSVGSIDVSRDMFLNLKILKLSWTGYGDDVSGHVRKMRKFSCNTNLLNIRLQKELG